MINTPVCVYRYNSGPQGRPFREWPGEAKSVSAARCRCRATTALVRSACRVIVASAKARCSLSAPHPRSGKWHRMRAIAFGLFGQLIVAARPSDAAEVRDQNVVEGPTVPFCQGDCRSQNQVATSVRAMPRTRVLGQSSSSGGHGPAGELGW